MVLPVEVMKEVIYGVLKTAGDPSFNLDFEKPFDFDTYFLDTTCVKALIHFPVDWVLLRDGARTVMKAIKQAHERIIGERLVKNEDKILSLYEMETNVIVRGKAGAETEFGNTLLLGETTQGLIVDWKLWEDTAPGDAKLLNESLLRATGLGSQDQGGRRRSRI